MLITPNADKDLEPQEEVSFTQVEPSTERVWEVWGLAFLRLQLEESGMSDLESANLER